jgi:hypothetical protein
MTTATQLYGTAPLTLTGTEKVAADGASATGGTTVQDIANLSGAPAVSVEFATDADITLTQAQYQAESIEFTDSPTTLTVGRNVIFPAHFPTKYVKNSTAKTLTLKKTGQTGVSLAAGGAAIVASGATDVVAGPGAATQYDTWCIAVSDETTAITTGTAKVTWYAPYACTIDEVFSGLSTASTSGAVTADVNKAGTSIFSTNPSIDATEDTSLTGTAAVLPTTTLAKGDKLTIDIDAAGTGAKGLKVYFRVHY